MDSTTFRETYIHPSLLEVFQKDVDNNYPVIDNSFQAANRESSNLVNNLPLEIQYLFEAEVYTAKRAMVNIYNYILQNKVELTNMTVSSLNINDGDIFTHFTNLRDSELSDLKAMREEIMVYLKSDSIRTNSNDGRSSQGAKLGFVVARNRFNGRYL